MGNFKRDIRRGAKGEEIVFEFLLGLDNIIDVLDVSKNKDYQKIDVDFLVIDESGDEIKVEVKTDSYKTNNMVYEVFSSRKKKSVGCFEKTEADFIFYYYINKGKLYVFDTLKLREFVHSKADEGVYKLIKMGDSASGYKICLDDFSEEIVGIVDL